MKLFGRRVAAVVVAAGSLGVLGAGLASASPAAVGEISTGGAVSTSWQDCAVNKGTNGPDWMIPVADAPCTIYLGRGGDDMILGGPGDDFIFGEGGNDKIAGAGGDDLIWGGQGDDLLVGEAGLDKIWGMNGDDVVDVRDTYTNDYANGGAGSDCLSIDNGENGYSGFEHVFVDTPPDPELCDYGN